jgi:hypothetical protein
MALWSTQPLTEIRKRNFPGVGKGWQGRNAENITAICEPIRKCGILDFTQPHGTLSAVYILSIRKWCIYLLS